MIDIKKDRKANDIWVITKTDSEGYHHQLAVTENEMNEIIRLWTE